MYCITVAKAAPEWNGTAVTGDPPSFKEIKLSDYKGTYMYGMEEGGVCMRYSWFIYTFM